MARVNWTGAARVHRLSASAIDLLDALGAPHTRLSLSLEGGAAQGIYHFSNGNGAPQQRVLGRTVEALLALRLITRDRSTAVATYVLSDVGRAWLARHDHDEGES